MDKKIWELFDSQILPDMDEVNKQAAQESILFPPAEEITADWLKQSQLYQFLFGLLFKSRTGVERLEDKISLRNISPAAEGSKNYYQKYDRMGLRYFYLRGVARVERLSDEDRESLEQCLKTPDEDTYRKALSMVENTFGTVMAVSPDNPETVYEPKQTLHGDYRIEGKNIPLAMRSVADFNPDGSLKSEEAELQRIQTFTNIWKQIDPALSADLGCGTTTAVEVFEV